MNDFSSLEGTLDTVEFALINLVKSYPELYNSQEPANRDKRRKDLAWAEIARQLSKDEGWCYAKWKNLSDYYKKRKKVYDNGSGATMRRWVYYDALSFLDMYENNREDSKSVIMINSSGEHSRSSAEFNQNCFDETQYQSLDGIVDRADMKLRHFLAPVIEETNCPPAAKKQRIISAPSTYSHTQSALLNHRYPTQNIQITNMQTKNPVISPFCGDDDDDDSEPVPFLTVHTNNKLTSRSVPNSYTDKKISTSRENGNRCANSSLSEKLSDCPHYHFCMSLASRFRKMDPATATYTQMKIMEIFLKAEFPEEYKKRMENTS